MPGSPLVERFRQVSAAFADSPAVLGDDGSYDYAELAATAGGIADALLAAQVRPGDRVALLLDHGPRTIAALLGTLAAGAVYVPLDPAHPPARIATMADDADVAVVLTDRARLDTARELAGDRAVLVVQDIGSAPLPVLDIDPDSPAYLLFTSGSTGRPKAVEQTHASVLHHAGNQVGSLEITPVDRLSLVASFGFDAAGVDLFPALLTGAAVATVDLRRHGVGHLAAVLADRAVTILHCTPTVYRYLLDALGPHGRLPGVRTVLLGGEPALRSDLRAGRERFAEGAMLINGYGATEITFATHHHVQFDIEDEGGADEALPVGVALPGHRVSLRDPDDRDTAPGQVGEIVVHSPAVAVGYRGDRERTAARFGRDADGRFYRTGDLGRFTADGTLMCLGRVDRQLTVRGYRVEPGEVESHLRAAPEVAAAVVSTHGEDLVAHVEPVPGHGGSDLGARLRRALADALPEHLVPSRITVLDRLPLTVSGKVDVLALPQPDVAPVRKADLMNPTEHAVHEAWCAALGSGPVGVSVSFFDAGGHSLLLGVVQQRVSAAFGVPVALVDLLTHPTIRDQARFVDELLARARGETTHPARTPVAALPAGDGDLHGDEIAVVGLACRVPGADDPEQFWANLCAGVDSVHDHTDDELHALGIGPVLLADPDHVRASGRVEGVTDVDAAFFGFTGREAALTDPQHRLLLETSWWALEDAGCDPQRHPGSIGVFTSSSVNRYFLFHLFDNPEATGTTDPDDWESRLAGRHLADHLPGQIAYRLGLDGPATAVQSACSSSLVAVCTAAQALTDLRCDVALVGGVSVAWPRQRRSPGSTASPDGRCRAFDAEAQGSGLSTGAVSVVLKRLADARADGDRVHAVLAGWAVTNDGQHRAGYAVPGVHGQAAAVTEALAAADLDADRIGMVETHGSGTPLGDAIEVAALTRAFRDAGAADDGATALGAVKTNIGHLDAGAGLVGLVKAVLAVREGLIPGNLHFTRANPDLLLDAGPFHVPTVSSPWPADLLPRYAGVSAVGVGGTNAHVVLGQAPQRPAPSAALAGPWLVPISARTPTALRAVADRLGARLAADPTLHPTDVATTLAMGRQAFEHRASVWSPDRETLLAALAAIADPTSEPAPVARARTVVLDVESGDQSTVEWLRDRLDTAVHPGDPTAVTLRVVGSRCALPGADPIDPTAALGELWALGVAVAWDRALTGSRVSLPGYPFERSRHWIDAPARNATALGGHTGRHAEMSS